MLGFFWFLCAAVWMVLIATTIRPKVADAARRDLITPDEGRTFVRGLAISIGLVCGILGIIALVADQPAPFCIEPLSFHDWPSAATNGLPCSLGVRCLAGSGSDRELTCLDASRLRSRMHHDGDDGTRPGRYAWL